MSTEMDAYALEPLAAAHARERADLVRRIALIKAALEDERGGPEGERSGVSRGGLTEAIRLLERQGPAGA